MKQAIFLDRDGVINNVIIRGERPYTPRIDELKILPGVPEALKLLQDLDFITLVFTNQPDISQGKTSVQEVEQIHQMMRANLALNDIKYCPHTDLDNCLCRKPKPGMILQFAQEWDILLPQSYAVGDRWRDIEAGQNAGCSTVLLGDGYKERPIKADHTFADLLSFALFLKKQRER